MEELNQLFKGFNVLTTPYDKVDNRVITKKNAITLLNQIGGDDPVDAGRGHVLLYAWQHPLCFWWCNRR